MKVLEHAMNVADYEIAAVLIQRKTQYGPRFREHGRRQSVAVFGYLHVSFVILLAASRDRVARGEAIV